MTFVVGLKRLKMSIHCENIREFDEYLARIEGELFVNATPAVPKRYLRDVQNPIDFYTDTQFKSRYRFNKETVMQMMTELQIQSKLETTDRRGLPVPPLIQLLSALQFYATGSFQTVIADLKLISLSQSTMSRLLHRVTYLIARQLPDHVLFPRTSKGMLANQDAFYQEGSFRGITGLVDATHIPIENPGGRFAETYRNRKRFCSLNVQVVCGPRGEILDIVARWPGSTHDAHVFINSAVKMRYEQGSLTECLVGDACYPCLTYILTPLLTTSTESEERYNRAHKNVRNIIECCIMKWKKRMLCLKKGLARKPERAIHIICACAILHNIAVRLNDKVPEGDLPSIEVPMQTLVQPSRSPGVAFRQSFISKYFL